VGSHALKVKISGESANQNVESLENKIIKSTSSSSSSSSSQTTRNSNDIFVDGKIVVQNDEIVYAPLATYSSSSLFSEEEELINFSAGNLRQNQSKHSDEAGEGGGEQEAQQHEDEGGQNPSRQEALFHPTCVDVVVAFVGAEDPPSLPLDSLTQNEENRRARAGLTSHRKCRTNKTVVIPNALRMYLFVGKFWRLHINFHVLIKNVFVAN